MNTGCGGSTQKSVAILQSAPIIKQGKVLAVPSDMYIFIADWVTTESRLAYFDGFPTTIYTVSCRVVSCRAVDGKTQTTNELPKCSQIAFFASSTTFVCRLTDPRRPHRRSTGAHRIHLPRSVAAEGDGRYSSGRTRYRCLVQS